MAVIIGQLVVKLCQGKPSDKEGVMLRHSKHARKGHIRAAFALMHWRIPHAHPSIASG